MAYPIRSDTVFIDIYHVICNAIVDDPAVAKLLDGVVLDFDIFDGEITEGETEPGPDSPPDDVPPPSNKTKSFPPFKKVPKPRNPPKIYLIPTSGDYSLESTCNNKLTINYSVVMENFYYRSVQFNKLAFRLLQLLRTIRFGSIQEDGFAFCVLPQVEGFNWEYDQYRQTMNYTINFTVDVRI